MRIGIDNKTATGVVKDSDEATDTVFINDQIAAEIAALTLTRDHQDDFVIAPIFNGRVNITIGQFIMEKVEELCDKHAIMWMDYQYYQLVIKVNEEIHLMHQSRFRNTDRENPDTPGSSTYNEDPFGTPDDWRFKTEKEKTLHYIGTINGNRPFEFSIGHYPKETQCHESESFLGYSPRVLTCKDVRELPKETKEEIKALLKDIATNPYDTHITTDITVNLRKIM